MVYMIRRIECNILSFYFIIGALRFPTGTSNLYGLEPDHINTETIPIITFAAYQGAIAIITPALISGAVVGRMKLLPYILFVFLWTTVCYDPLCRWVFYPQGIVYLYIVFISKKKKKHVI